MYIYIYIYIYVYMCIYIYIYIYMYLYRLCIYSEHYRGVQWEGSAVDWGSIM